MHKDKNRNTVLADVKENGLALEHASDELKDDKDVVLAAVKENGLALEHASDELKDDKDVVLAAVRQNHEAFMAASTLLQKNDNVKTMHEQSIKYRDAYDELVILSFSAHKDIGFTLLDIILTVEKLKNEGKNLQSLKELLENTCLFLRGTIESEQYLAIAKKTHGAPCLGMQVLGGMMMALGAMIAALGVATAATGIATIPGAIAATAGTALLASGYGLFAAASKAGSLSKCMADLATSSVKKEQRLPKPLDINFLVDRDDEITPAV